MDISIDAFVLKYPLTGIGQVTTGMIRAMKCLEPDHRYRLLVDDLRLGEAVKDMAEDFELCRVPCKYPRFFQRHLHRAGRWISGFLPESLADRHGLPFRAQYPRMKSGIEKATRGTDVYHCLDWFLYPSPSARKNVITIHDLTADLFPQFHDPSSIDKEKCKRSLVDQFDVIIAVSESTRRDLESHWGVPSGKIQVVYPATASEFGQAPIQNPEALHQRYNIPTPRYLLSVSTIEPRKNLSRVLQAFSEYCESSGDQDISLVCTGAWGWKNETLKAQLNEMKHGHRVIFTGYVPSQDLPSLYTHATAFLYASLYEGFGIPILEAMTCGTPVITSNLSSMPEVIRDTGILVDPLQVNDIARAIAQIIDHPSQSQEMGQAARQRSRLFSWEKSARQLLDIYQA